MNMKKIVFFVVPLVVALALFQGCDRIRASLGKPTSADLARISEELKAREQFLRDSIDAVRAAEAQQDSIAQPAVQPADQPAASAGQPLKRYYAVAGAFKNPEGAQKYVEILQASNLPVHLFDFKSGLTVVCMEGHDNFEDARRDLATLKELKLAGSDPWIYNTNQKLHK